jgi:Putative lactococcus lactis phage r1t holin
MFNWKDISTRAGLTFVQAFLAVVLATGVNNFNSWADVKPAVVAAVAALLSFVFNIVKQYNPNKNM